MSKHVKLQRLDTNDAGTIGKLSVDGKFVCFAVERPWLDNRRNVSCIPAGRYDLAYVDSPKFGRRLEVKDVPDRSQCPGASPATGSATRSAASFPELGVSRSVMEGPHEGYYTRMSRAALKDLEALLPDDGTVHEIVVEGPS